MQDEFADFHLDEDKGRASVLEFDNNNVEFDHTDDEIKDISLKRQLTLQQLKIESIGSVSLSLSCFAVLTPPPSRSGHFACLM